MNRVLITGAAGGIGRSLRESLLGVYRILRLSDRVPLAPARTGEEVDLTELSDTGAVARMVDGVDGTRGRNEGGAYVWYPSGRSNQPDSLESVHAPRVRSVDNADAS